MSERWLRLYENVVNDPKMQRLPAEVFKGLINLWCIASANGGVLPPIADIAFTLRTSEARVMALLDRLREAALLDDDGTDIRPHNWNSRQFKSDVSTERVKRYRERQRGASGNGDATLHETPPDTETDTETDTDTEKKSSLRSPKKATRLSPDWRPSPEDLEYARSQGMPDGVIGREAENYRDYWIAKPGAGGTKLDWPATWRTWIRKACERGGFAPTAPPANGASRTYDPSIDDDARLMLAAARARGQWAAKWGARPNTPDCRINPALILPTDGEGWTEWGT